MRKLYEIDAEIDAIIDSDTGEVFDPEKLEALQIERSTKLEGVALGLKNIKAEMEMVDAEEKKFHARKMALSNRYEHLKLWLSNALAGEKMKTAKVNCYYSTSKSVYIEDGYAPEDLPECFQRKVVEADKAGLKEALQNGAVIPGVLLMEKKSLVVK